MKTPFVLLNISSSTPKSFYLLFVLFFISFQLSGHNEILETIASSSIDEVNKEMHVDFPYEEENIKGLKSSSYYMMPANDLCADAVLVSCGNVYAGTTIGGTNIGVGANCSQGSTTSAGSWYMLSGDGGSYVASTCNDATFDTVIDIYSGSCSSLVCETGNDDTTGCTGNTSEVTFSTVSGTDYFIYVRSFFAGTSGTYNLSFSSANIVSNTNDSGGGSLRDVIACAEPGSTITFDPSTDGMPIMLSSGQIVIDKDLTIIGNGMDVTLIDGSLDDGSRIFHCNAGHDIRMEDLTIQNGGSATYNQDGAGIYTSANLDLLNVGFKGNHLINDQGSAIIQFDGTLDIVNCLFDGNISEVSNTTNSVIWIEGVNSITTIFQSVFVNNVTLGGLVIISFEEITVNQNTFVNNTNTGVLQTVNSTDDLNFHNNIIGDGGNVILSFLTSVVSASNNISIDADSDLPSADNNIVGDPLLLDPSAGDFGLQNGSPAIGQGNNAQIPEDILDVDGDGDTGETIEADYLGNDRIAGCATNVDIGAVENSALASMVVLNSNDDGYGSLRQAVECADPGATITFDVATDGMPIMLSSGQLVIDKDLTINGNGYESTIIDGQLDGTSRLIQINDHTVNLNDLAFINGGSTAFTDVGGGVYMFGTHMTTINNCSFEGNESSAGGSAVCSYTGSMTANNSIFKGNISTFGSGTVALINFQTGASTTLFNQCLFVDQITSQTLISFGTNVEVVHSTFIQDGGSNLFCIGGEAESTVKNNIFKGTGKAVGTFGSGTTISNNNVAEVLGNMPSMDNIQGAAIFIDETNEDYRLSACSPGIDEGVSLANAPAIDFEGDARLIGAAIDIGYDEYAGAEIVDIQCGVTYTGDTSNGANLIEVYNCTVDLESGPEIVHRITTTEVGDLVATLSNEAIDIDVAILTECGNPSSCLSFGLSQATYSDAPIGTYYIVVDGFQGAVGSYELTVTGSACEALPCTEDVVEVNAPEVPDGLYHAIQNLDSDATVTNSGVVFKAGDDIDLNNGFEVQVGLEFDAIIEDCPIVNPFNDNDESEQMNRSQRESIELMEREKRRLKQE